MSSPVNAPHKIKPIFIVSLIVITFILTYIAYNQEFHEHYKFAVYFYDTICLFFVHHPDPVPHNAYFIVAEYISVFVVLIGLFSIGYNGLRKAYLSTKVKFTYKDHVVIFSLTNLGKNIAIELLKKGYKVVIIETHLDNQFIEQVEKYHGIILHTKQMTDRSTLDNAGLDDASICILAADRDETNIELAGVISKYRKQYSSPEKTLKILVHIQQTDNGDILKDYFDITNEETHYDLEIFNIYHASASKIYDLYPPHKYFNEDAEDENAIAIIGYNQSAKFFLMENIILSHYPELENIKIYLVDKDADTVFHEFHYKRPFHKEFVDIVPVKLINKSFYANFAWSKEHIEKLTKVKIAYVFGDNDSELINTAANFRQFLYTQTLSTAQVPIVVCLPEDTGIVDLLNATKNDKDDMDNVFAAHLNIHYFKLMSDTCTSEGLIEQKELTDRLSKLINFFYSIKYEFGSVLEQKFNITTNIASITDDLENSLLALHEKHETLTEKFIEHYILEMLSKKTGISIDELSKHLGIDKQWHLLSNRKKDSNRYAARQLAAKVHSLKRIGCYPFTTANIIEYYPRLAPMEHKRWCAEKMIFNFKYGPLPLDRKEKKVVKDILKIHDQLLPYDKLSEFEKDKDLNIFLMLPLLNTISPLE
jgi:Trk K+ transport system NAD-binding subunit